MTPDIPLPWTGPWRIVDADDRVLATFATEDAALGTIRWWAETTHGRACRVPDGVRVVAPVEVAHGS